IDCPKKYMNKRAYVVIIDH
ncbi:MAG: hypothetical protein CO092_00375, partial [Candidatus Aenigmarchaeota archaeon CG_4_9_14_3_um_filter_37_18]